MVRQDKGKVEEEETKRGNGLIHELIGWTLAKGIKVIVGYNYGIIYDFRHQRAFQVDKWTGHLLSLLAHQKIDTRLRSFLRSEKLQSEACNSFRVHLQKLRNIQVLVPIGQDDAVKEEETELTWDAFPQTPSRVEIELTTYCNFMCPHCYLGMDANTTQLPYALLTRLLKQIHGMGVEHIQFTGGEPFIRRDLVRILSAAYHPASEVELLTNGSLIKRSHLRMLKKYVSRIQITLYGMTPATYQCFTRAPNTFAKVMKSIEMISMANIPLRLIFTLTSYNYHEVDEFVDYCQRNQLDFSIGGTLPVGCAEFNPDVATIPKKVQEKIEQRYSHKDERLVFKDRACRSDRIAILADGRVTLCPLLRAQQFTAGSVYDDELLKIWRNGCRRISDGLSVDKLETCRGCELRYICAGGCPILRKFFSIGYPCGLYYNKIRFSCFDI
ncbi:MAG: radical SAM protein [Methanophagales archaeon]|nr:radical SAM protein [Methanophagales archaeon]